MTNRIITSAMLDQNKLEHYGVKGMKWGVRRTQAELGNPPMKSVETLLLRLGVMGVKYLISNVSSKKIREEASDPSVVLNKLKDAKRIKPPESYLESLKNTNNLKSGNRNYTQNCPNTTLAYELRRRGYAVKAKPETKGLTMESIKELYSIKETDLKITGLGNPLKQKQNAKQLNDYFDSVPDGYRGAVGVHWSGGFGAHIFNVEKINNKVVLIDSQKGEYGDFKTPNTMSRAANSFKIHNNPSDYLSRAAKVEIFRTDTAIINETNLRDRVTKG